MRLSDLLGVPRDEPAPVRPAGLVRPGEGDLIETASPGPRRVEAVVPLGALGDLVLLGDATERRVALLRRPFCWWLRPIESLPAGVRAGEAVIAEGSLLEAFVVAGGGVEARVEGVVLASALEEADAEAYEWWPAHGVPASVAYEPDGLEPSEAVETVETVAIERPIR